ncbi:uncharacterized protein [Coffea arabica]|uniref:RNase H type-1 domain-containing protein n=1 Tax=Coffea arabica TaxID=13443 RepID=A0ABM4V3H4_COFAR
MGVLLFIKKTRAIKIFLLLWNSPLPRYVKLNIDESAMGNPGYSGGGGIIHDSYGRVIGAFSSFYGYQTNTKAEAMALMEGLQLCLFLDLCNVIVEMDSLTMLNTVKRLQKCPWRIHGEVIRISGLLAKVEFILTQCYRKVNFTVDGLAKLLVQNRISSIYEATMLPAAITGVIHLDARQFPYIHRLSTM